MRALVLAAAVLGLGLTSASAQVSDPDMKCADYLKLVAQMGATPTTGNAEADKMAADMDAKMKAYCTANPAAKVTEAAEKAMMGN